MNDTKNKITINESVIQYYDADSTIKEFKSKINEAVEGARDVTVFSSSSVDEASHYIANFKQLEKRLEDFRKQVTAPILAKKQAVDKYFKDLITLFKPESSRLTKELMDWNKKQREIEEARKAREQEELEKSIITEGELFGDVDEVVPEIQIKTQTLKERNTAGITTRTNKLWKVTDFNKIPREYLLINEKLINEIRRKSKADDESNIPGIEFYTEETIMGGRI